MTLKPFEIHVSDYVLEDLHARLARTRYATASDPRFWAGGTDPGYLRELVTYLVCKVRLARGRAEAERLSALRRRCRGPAAAFRAPAGTCHRQRARADAAGHDPWMAEQFRGDAGSRGPVG